MVHELHINKRFTGVTVRPDSQYPTVWRIHVKGQVSDMVNLARAKDAALTWARRDGLGKRDLARWEVSKTGAGASLVHQNKRAA